MLGNTEESVECPVCFEDFSPDGPNRPHILVCGHSFCFKDIHSLMSATEGAYCPTCRTEISRVSYSDSFPPYNASLIGKLTSLSQLDSSSITLCANCDPDKQAVNATCYCLNCALEYCECCNIEVHKPRALRFHSQIPLSEKPIPEVLCSSHAEAMKHFCRDCSVLVCRDCVIIDGSHYGHSYCLASKIIDDQKEKLHGHISNNAKHSQELWQRIVQLEDTENTLQTKKEIFLLSLLQDNALLTSALQVDD